MTRFGLALSAFRRHIGRTIFTVLSVAMAFAIFVVLAAIENGMDGHMAAWPQPNVSIRSRRSTRHFPSAMQERYVATPDVTAVTYDTSFGGYFRDPKQRVPVMAMRSSSFTVIRNCSPQRPDRGYSCTTAAAPWSATSSPQKMGWHIGQTIPIQGGPPRRTAARRGSSTSTESSTRTPEGSAIHDANYDYINDGLPLRRRKDTVGRIHHHGRRSQEFDRVAASIDARFANARPIRAP